MSVQVSEFGKMADGRVISLYTIDNNGMKASVTDFGAILVSLFVPDGKGNAVDVVMGFDKGEDYFHNGSFFGATVGRNANRIANACFEIDGVKYPLAVNDNANNLHTDFEIGFHMQLFKAEVLENAVKFSYHSPDMEAGFPGNLDASVTYELTADHELKLHYEGVCDKKSTLNMTNHSYFNLYGHDHGDISDTTLRLLASQYTPIVPGAIPTGEIATVKGTPLDFTTAKAIGDEIDADWDQLTMVQGYDHNLVLDDYDGKLRLVAEAKAAGRTMEVYTDLPGIQFYAGNCISPVTGKNGVHYDKRGAFCLETQYFPNSINDQNFVQPIFEAGEKYDTETIYKFSWE